MKAIFIMGLIMSFITGCSAENVQVIEHIEVYAIERMGDTPNREGLWEIERYNKVNAITRNEESSRSGTTTKLYVVTDHYNNDGVFIHSSIKYDEYRKSTNYTDTKEEIKFEPLTILTVDTELPFKEIKLSEGEKAQVKEYVLNLIDTLE